MDTSKKINELRRNTMHYLTKGIGNSQKTQYVELKSLNEIKRVLICRPNHRLGNLLLISPLIQEITTTFPNCKIDLFTKGNLAPILFKNYTNIDKIIQLPRKPFSNIIKYIQGWISIKKQHYDMVINVVTESSSGRLSTQFSNSKYKVFGESNEEMQLKFKDSKHMGKNPIYALRAYLKKSGINENNEEIPTLNLKLSKIEIEEGKKLLNELTPNKRKTICLFTYATGDKCYSETWWGNFYKRLKDAFSNYNIIEVLPVENISKIGFKAPSFYSKDIRQLGSLIANTSVFIGADSGIMHLASSVDVPTVGLFSVTNIEMYQPYNKKSLAINTNKNDIDEMIDRINTLMTSI